MKSTLAIVVAGFGFTLAGVAFAAPARISADIPIVAARTVCNEYGRCWDRDDERESYRDRSYRRWDGDRDYGHERRYDRDRGYGRRDRDNDDD